MWRATTTNIMPHAITSTACDATFRYIPYLNPHKIRILKSVENLRILRILQESYRKLNHESQRLEISM